MTTLSFSTRNRIRGGAIALVVEGLIGYALVLGFSVDIPARIGDELKLFNLAAEPPPPPVVKPPRPQPTKSHKRRGAASPRNLKSTPTDIVAPPVPPILPPPIAAAPKAGTGNDPSAGASHLPGPGTGAGGIGTGTGSGGAGDGDGGDAETGPRHIRGKIKDSDYPDDARLARVEGSVSVRYTVETDGRATHCTITRSSGYRSLDVTTCRLIEQRFRYRPAKDGQGRPVVSFVGSDHDWYIEDEPGADSGGTRPAPRDDR